MGYLSIPNLYRERDILLFKECYALEKIHGSSAHIGYRNDSKQVTYFAGGEKYETFVALFDKSSLLSVFETLKLDYVTIFGEVYGGRCQGMKDTYGERLRFVAFDVRIGDDEGGVWLSVPQAEDIVVNQLKLDFVAYEKASTDLASLDRERDRPSRQAVKNGILEPKPAEGVVLRPLVELRKNNGQRVICKHKRAEFRETKTPRQVDEAKLKVLSEAKEVAEEWVTEMRLSHVLQKLASDGAPAENIEDIRRVLPAMLADVEKESTGEIVEIVWSEDVRAAIKKKAADLYKARVMKI